jgi:hypothetical protein
MSVDATVALISLAQAKTFLKIPNATTSEDSFLESLINNVSSLASRYCARTFVSTAFTEYYDGDGSDKLYLRNYPIVSIANLYDDLLRTFGADSAIDITNDVLIHAGAGIVQLWNNESAFAKGKANIKIVYNAGYASIPYDLQHATLLMVLFAYKRQYQDQRIGIQSETIGDRTTTFSNDDIPNEAQLILDRYVRRGVASVGY